MYTEPLKVRKITAEEFQNLGTEDRVYVGRPDWDGPGLVPAVIKATEKYTGSGDVASFPYRTIFNSESFAALDAIWVADDAGEEMPVQRTAGTRLSLSLFFPDMTEEEIQEKLYGALRGAFGPGVVGVWNERYGLVSAVKYDVFERESTFTNGEAHFHLKFVAGDLYADEARTYIGTMPSGSFVMDVHKPRQGTTKTI